MCIVTEFIAGLLKFEFVFRRHIAGTEAEHVCDEYQSTNFLVILHDRSNEEEVVGFNVLAISAEELEVVISAKNVLAENDLRALFSNCGLKPDLSEQRGNSGNHGKKAVRCTSPL